jgi:hypothetical protein
MKSNFEYIAVSGGFAYGLAREHQGFIFRRIDCPGFALDGHHSTLRSAIVSAMKYGVVVNDVNKTMRMANEKTIDMYQTIEILFEE